MMRLLFITAICVVYLLLRLWHLTDSCLWFDEIFSVHAAEHSWDTIFSFVAADLIHPPLFYLLLKFWISIGGEGVFWLRLLPVLFSIVAIIPFLHLCRELKIEFWTASLALFFLAVNGSLIKYAQEVRMYSLLMCLSLFSMWLFAKYFYRGKSFIWLVIANVLLVYSHYFGWFVVLSEVAAILIFQRIKWRRIAIMLGVVFVVFSPWAIAVMQAARSGSELGQNIGWMTRPGFSALAQLALNLIEPFYFSASSIDPVSILRISVPILMLIVIAAIVYFPTGERAEQRNMRVLILFAAIPIILAFFASWILPYSIWGTRHLIIIFPPVMLLISFIINALKFTTLKTAFLTLIFLFSGYAFVLSEERSNLQFIWCGWEELAGETNWSEPTTVYTFEDLAAYHFWFAVRESGKVKIVKVGNVEGLMEDKAYFLPRNFEGVRKIDESLIEGREFWVAFQDKQWDKTRPPLSNLAAKGYNIGEPKIYEAQNRKAFLVKVEK